jgi:hypothetical protein
VKIEARKRPIYCCYLRLSSCRPYSIRLTGAALGPHWDIAGDGRHDNTSCPQLNSSQTECLTSTVAVLALMLGLAVGIDYALFITSRFSDERARGSEPEDAADRAVGTAGSAVVLADTTVFIAPVGLGGSGSPNSPRRAWAARARHPLGEVRAASAGGRADDRRTRSRHGRTTPSSLELGLPAAAVALDAFVVRMAIAPAVLALLGHRAWWPPRILNRVLPNVDIEGEALSRHVPTSAAESEAAVRRLPVGRG